MFAYLALKRWGYFLANVSGPIDRSIDRLVVFLSKTYIRRRRIFFHLSINRAGVAFCCS